MYHMSGLQWFLIHQTLPTISTHESLVTTEHLPCTRCCSVCWGHDSGKMAGTSAMKVLRLEW
jgi:hypothetical protein